LYFVIKNHPLADGNKRTGAFLFVDFLNRNNTLIRDGQSAVCSSGLCDFESRSQFVQFTT
jgi:prophage maintenance system killer protein